MPSGKMVFVLSVMTDHIWGQMENVYKFLNYAKHMMKKLVNVRAATPDMV